MMTVGLAIIERFLQGKCGTGAMMADGKNGDHPLYPLWNLNSWLVFMLFCSDLGRE